MEVVFVLVALLVATNLVAYLSMSYFLYLFVKAKRKETFEGLSKSKRAGIFLSLPIVTIFLAAYHKLVLTKEKEENDRNKD